MPSTLLNWSLVHLVDDVVCFSLPAIVRLVFYHNVLLDDWSQSWLCCQKATGDLIMCIDVLHGYREAATPYAASFSFLRILFSACCGVSLSGNALKWFVAKHLIYLYMILQTICNSILAPTLDFIYQTFNTEQWYIALVNVPYCLTVWSICYEMAWFIFLPGFDTPAILTTLIFFKSKKKEGTKNMWKLKVKICL